MRKLLMLFSVMCMWLMLAQPAQAGHGNEYFDGPQGPITLAGKTYCLTDSFLNNTTSGQEDQARSRIEEATDHTNSTTQMDYNFDVESSGSCSGQLNFVDLWNDATGSNEYDRMNSLCANIGGGQSRVTIADLDDLEIVGEVVAWTLTCDTNLNGFIDWQYIAFDLGGSCGGIYTFGGDPDCWSYDGSFAAAQWHWKGVFLHEHIHGIGFWDHFNPPDPGCDSSPKNTMCEGSSAFQGSTAGSTLESHDIAEINENY